MRENQKRHINAIKYCSWEILCISSYYIILVCNMYTAVEYLLIAVKSQQGYRGNHSTSHILGWLKNYMLDSCFYIRCAFCHHPQY